MTFVGENKEKAFTAVFDKNYETLCLYAVRFTEDLVEAEDVVQEAFVRFWEMYRDRLTVENARPLLYRMVRNMCVDRARAKRWSTVDAEVMADQLVYYFQPESEGDSKIDLLMEAVRNLPEKCQQVLIAICFNEKKYKEVAEEMSVSVNTVKTQLARALKLLREGLNKEDFELFLTFFIFSC
ncbi:MULTISPECIES: RNA polymerase sigma factor [Odoribacteraceae]|uniref:RNA polymerase sigma factor n=1 Tax=Odoribacteraceae TaxID=1853231 RepID=UPI000E4F14A8|nr:MULTISPECIES: sigma-70 family RNA polymerase sigma factor [Odoribacteraceae]MCQ4874353.1 sigma-70 family RNA polymerase sigma factor [Butyricimonas paravirosa]RHR77161.1 RNA polymerase subunit sigma-70 [Odoribacter sp. AF15-53]